MDIKVPMPGKYVVAISGGVDSVVLLHSLVGEPGLELVVAHFDHGIREDSPKDRVFVKKLAHKYSLPFVSDEGKLGATASEAVARKARYTFLRKVQKEQTALAIITAHHQDDVLETVIINLLRGTGRRGLTSLKQTDDIKRPLLAISKSTIQTYAKKHDLPWREDSTNSDETYLRNYVRRRLLVKFSQADRAKLLALLQSTQSTNQELDALLVKYIKDQSVSKTINRAQFAQLSHQIAREVMAAWLRSNQINGYDKAGLERLVVAAKTSQPAHYIDVVNGNTMLVAKDYLALQLVER